VEKASAESLELWAALKHPLKLCKLLALRVRQQGRNTLGSLRNQSADI
jgi:hypothetical protein